MQNTIWNDIFKINCYYYYYYIYYSWCWSGLSQGTSERFMTWAVPQFWLKPWCLGIVTYWIVIKCVLTFRNTNICEGIFKNIWQINIQYITFMQKPHKNTNLPLNSPVRELWHCSYALYNYSYHSTKPVTVHKCIFL